MKSFLEYLLEANKNSDVEQIQDLLIKNGYNIKQSSSNVIIIGSNDKDKVKILNEIASLIHGEYDNHAKGSSIGAVIKNKIKIFVKPINKSAGTDAEYEQVDIINNFIKNNNGKILLKNPDGKYINVTSAIKVNGTPKADIALLNGNTEVMWISHKKGNSANDFQNYGGISPKEIQNLSQENKEFIKKAVACIKILFTDENGKKKQFYDVHIIKDLPNEIQMYSIYGKDYGNIKYGQNNVTYLIQGTIGFKQIKNNEFELTASGNIHKNGEILSGDYIPKIATKTANDRTTYNMYGIRIGIYPTAYHKKAKDILKELNAIFKIKANDTTDFFDKYIISKNINDFYHKENILNLEDILSYQLNNF